MSKGLKRVLLVLLFLIIGVLVFLKMLLPGANMEEVPNPIRDRSAKDWTAEEAKVATNSLKEVYFGDLHVHTNCSMDAYFTGNETTPDSAYRFGQGYPIQVVGNRIQLQKPLDFMAVTDHSEFLGEIYTYQNKESERYGSLLAKYIRNIREHIKEDENVKNRFRRIVYSPLVKQEHSTSFEGFETTKTTWSTILEATERHYQPGKFTTLAGYEWTLGLIGHIHRNVIFRDMKVPDYPISSFEARNEQELWESLQLFTDSGSTVLAIPHNSNLSSGMMFTSEMPNGDPITADYARQRQQFERLVEVHQNKGNSEVYAEFWKNDEYAGFENYYEGELLKKNFVRDALKKGLEYEDKLGVNPFKYGMIGSTDTHNSTPGNTAENSGNPGHFGYSDANAEVRSKEGWAISGDRPPEKTYKAVNPGGLVAVWAEANTRGHIYDGLVNRETYATSGNRVKVRFFGGFSFEQDYEDYETMVKAGYEKGVPMGNDLPTVEVTGTKPSFIIWAAKDPNAANLDKIQVVKGWYDGAELKEKIIDVVVSENGAEATVNLETGAFDETKGAAELSIVWTDEDFDPSQRAFYYLRVLEIETARWNVWDEILYGVKFPESVPKTIKERAWSSPIWYAPK